MGKSLRGLVGLLALIAAVQSQAITVGFSFDSDGSSFFSGTSIPGTVTGTISGLVDNTNDQIAGIQVEVLTYPTLLGGSIDSGLVASAWTTVFGAGFSVLNGELVGAEWIGQFGTSGFDQLRLNIATGSNPTMFNILTFDGGSTFAGNGSSFAGATYTTLTAVPEPSLFGLMLLGLVALGLRRRV